jgi:MbtH protein
MKHGYMVFALLTILVETGCQPDALLTTRLHVMKGDQGAFSEAGDGNVRTLTITTIAEDVIWFTDRPLRIVGTETVDAFLANTWPSVLAGEHPVGAVSYRDADGYWNMAPVEILGFNAGQQEDTISWLVRMDSDPGTGPVDNVHLYLDDRGASETEEGSSAVFLHGAAQVSLEPGAKSNEYTLRLSYPYPAVTVINTHEDLDWQVKSLDAFIEDVWIDDFADNPPNAAIQIAAPDGTTHIVVAVLSAPEYDPSTDELTYAATLLMGDGAVEPGPGVLFIDDWSDPEWEDTTIYGVVMNHEEQYSIWPADRELPLGWEWTGFTGTKTECLDYIEEIWTDMRPLSLRQKMREWCLANFPAGECG